MSDIASFVGWRFNLAHVGDLSSVTLSGLVTGPSAGPFSHDDSQVGGTPVNIRQLLPGGAAPEHDAVATNVAETLKRWKLDGVLHRDHAEALYVYHQAYDWDGRHYVRKGLFARVKLDSILVPSHASSPAATDDGVLDVLRTARVQAVPVSAVYDDVSDVALQSVLEDACRLLTPMETTDAAGTEHRLFTIADHAVIGQVKALFRETEVFLIGGQPQLNAAKQLRDELLASGAIQNDLHPANWIMTHLVSTQQLGPAVRISPLGLSTTPAIVGSSIRALEDMVALESLGTGATAAADLNDLLESSLPTNSGPVHVGIIDQAGECFLASTKSTDLMPLPLKIAARLRATAGAAELPVPLRNWKDAFAAIGAGTVNIAFLFPPLSSDSAEFVAHAAATASDCFVLHPPALSGLIVNLL